MKDLDNENEIKSLRSLVVRLAGEIDYKNHLLMEKDENNANLFDSLTSDKGFLSEKAEKDNLLDEKSGVINELKAEKELLVHEISTVVNTMNEKMQKLDEISGAFSLLITQNAKKDVLIEEKERLLHETSESLNTLKVENEQIVNEKDAEISTLMALNLEQEKLIEEISAAIKILMTEKDQLREAYLEGSVDIEKMKLEIEKLQQDLDSKKKELETLKEVKNKISQENEILKTLKIEPNLHIQEFAVSSVRLEEEQNCAMVLTELRKFHEMEELRAQVDGLKKEVEEKAEALQNMELDNRTLMIKELRSNHELQAARRAAIDSFPTMQRTRVNIGIKRIGEVDQKPFREACSMRFNSGNWDEEFGNWEEKSMELCSLWQQNISDPGWQPFKHEDINGKLTEVIDENDKALKELGEEWGEEVYQAVIEALLGVNEYNASGRYPVSELWNFKEKKRATLGEVIQYVIKQWKIHKKK